MKRIKIIKVYFPASYTDWGSDFDINELLNITEWEEVNEVDFKFLRDNLYLLNDVQDYGRCYTHIQYLMVEDTNKEELPLIVEDIKQRIQKRKKEEKEREEKKAIAAAKRKKTREKKKQEEELKQLKELQAKYNKSPLFNK